MEHSPGGAPRTYGGSVAYGKQAMADPQIRDIYLKIALEKKQNKRPYDMAVWDYYNHHNNLLGKRSYWNVEHWRSMQKYRKRKKR